MRPYEYLEYRYMARLMAGSTKRSYLCAYVSQDELIQTFYESCGYYPDTVDVTPLTEESFDLMLDYYQKFHQVLEA